MRSLDISLSLIGLAVLSPLLLLLALAVKLSSPGPVFCRARRVGKDGRVFTLYKFRSMAVGRDVQGPKVTGQRRSAGNSGRPCPAPNQAR